MKPKIATRFFAWAGLTGVLMAAPSLRAQNYRLYVDNSTDKTVSVIDLNSLKVVSDIEMGDRSARRSSLKQAQHDSL